MNTFSHELADGVCQFSTCHATALSVVTAPTIRRLAGLEPRTLASMHGSSTTAAARSLRLADACDAKRGL
jgi:hypothetical protein